MFFPFVAVTLPPDTPPAFVVVLIDACTQAYPSGGCRQSAASPMPSPSENSEVPQEGGPNTASTSQPVPTVPAAGEEGQASPDPAQTGSPQADSSESDASEPRETILGTVSWVDDNTAELLLGLPHWRNNRWLERQLDFKEEDELIERHRAVGFALGSLAGTVAEVARLEQESHDDEEAAAAKTQAPPPQQEPASPSLPEPEVVDSPFDSKRSVLSARPSVAPQLWLGVDAGTGFAEPRLGGVLGLGLRLWSPWTLTLKVRYAHEAIDEKQVTTDYANIGLAGGAHFRLGWLESHVALGGALDLIWIRSLAPRGKQVPRRAWWGTGEITLLPADLAVAPFLTLGAALGDAWGVGDISGLSYGPLQFHGQLGLSLRFDLL